MAATQPLDGPVKMGRMRGEATLLTESDTIRGHEEDTMTATEAISASLAKDAYMQLLHCAVQIYGAQST